MKKSYNSVAAKQSSSGLGGIFGWLTGSSASVPPLDFPLPAYCVVSKESVSKQISIPFLERVKADFKKRYGGGKADTTIAKSLNKEFGLIMKEHMKYIIDHAEEIEKLLKVKAQV